MLLRRRLADGVATLAANLPTPVGGIQVAFQSSGTNLAGPGDSRDLRLQVVNPTLRDPALYLRP